MTAVTVKRPADAYSRPAGPSLRAQESSRHGPSRGNAPRLDARRRRGVLGRGHRCQQAVLSTTSPRTPCYPSSCWPARCSCSACSRPPGRGSSGPPSCDDWPRSAVFDGDVWPDESLPASAWGAAVLSGVLYYGLAFWFYRSALSRVPALVAGASLPLIPVFGVAAGYLVGERLSERQFIAERGVEPPAAAA